LRCNEDGVGLRGVFGDRRTEVKSFAPSTHRECGNSTWCKWPADVLETLIGIGGRGRLRLGKPAVSAQEAPGQNFDMKT